MNQAASFSGKESVPRQALALLVCLALVFTAAAIGALASASAGEFYAELERPFWAPPAWLFGPVWTLLYALMAVAGWLVWRKRSLSGARGALFLFLLQLVANAAWSWIFFAWRQGGVAFAEVSLLWLLVLATTFAFARLSRTAALLLLPYLAWVTLAAALTHALWQRNPELL